MLRGIIAASLLFTAFAHARPLTVEQRLSDFQQLNAIIDSGYGPLEFKKNTMKIDIVKLRADFETRIRAVKTNGEFYYLLSEYIASYHDGHFSAMIPSFRMAIYPVSVERVQGRVLVEEVVKGMPASMFPFQRGDEIVEFNGRPVQEEIEKLARYTGSGNRDTELRMATWMLFYRPGMQVPVPTERNFTVTYRSHRTGELHTVNGSWLIQGPELDESEGLAFEFSSTDLGRTTDWQRMDYFNFSNKEFWDEFYAGRDEMVNNRLEARYSCNGATRIKIPRGAVIVSEKPFVAYYHPTPYGNVGYLRVPHYSPRHRDGSPAIDEWFAMYEYVIHTFEKNTVGLIIDQDHNCGGFVQFANQFVSLFLEKPVKPLQFSLLATKAEYLNFASWASTVPENTLLRQELSSVANLIYNSWKLGMNLTPPISLDGKTELYPHHVRYTKPVVMLIDEMAASGGDAVPAMLQGYGRAKLLGNQTASMGGHVEPQAPLSFSRVQVRMTKSLFYRPDGTPIENNGAVPDYPYAPTFNDFMNEYQEYQAYYLKVLGELVTGRSLQPEEVVPMTLTASP